MVRRSVVKLLGELLQAGKRLSVRSALPLVRAEFPEASVKTLHDAFGRGVRKHYTVHVCAWERGNSGPPRPVYAWGEGKTPKKPAPMTNAQKLRRYRRRLQTENPDLYSRRQRRYQMNSRHRKGIAPHDPIALILLRKTE